jgi:ferredoxin
MQGFFQENYRKNLGSKIPRFNRAIHFQLKFGIKQLGFKMAIYITDDCINCGACEMECPNNAIYEGGVEWAIKDGTSISGDYKLEDGSMVDVEKRLNPLQEDYYFIVPDKCTECKGFHDEPQCAAVCPVDCCLPDPEREESIETLLARKERLHL